VIVFNRVADNDELDSLLVDRFDVICVVEMMGVPTTAVGDSFVAFALIEAFVAADADAVAADAVVDDCGISICDFCLLHALIFSCKLWNMFFLSTSL